VLVFLAGITIGLAFPDIHIFSLPWYFVSLAIILAVLAWWFIKSANIALSISVLLCLLAGIGKAGSVYAPSHFGPIIGSYVEFTGRIVTDPQVDAMLQRITIQPEHSDIYIQATIPAGALVDFGDKVWIAGKLQAARVSDAFNYARYLRAHNIQALMYRPQVLVIEPAGRYSLASGLLQIKSAYANIVEKRVGTDAAWLVKGVLVGGSVGQPPGIGDTFKQTGLTHILAVSGFNVSIAVASIALLAARLGRRAVTILGFGFIWILVILAGASGSVVRASLMGAVGLAAVLFGRTYKPLPVLLLVAAAMVAWRPGLLFWDLGFQLSFLATASIIIFTPRVYPFLRIYIPAFLAEIIATTVAAYIGAAPWILWKFGQVSVVGVLANVFIVPIIPFLMALGVCIWLPGIGWGFGWLAFWAVQYIVQVAGVFARIPGASIVLPVSWQLVLGVYALLLLWGFGTKPRQTKEWLHQRFWL
jgi:competence protein ComEC